MSCRVKNDRLPFVTETYWDSASGDLGITRI